jgi:hypothetical protein
MAISSYAVVAIFTTKIRLIFANSIPIKYNVKATDLNINLIYYIKTDKSRLAMRPTRSLSVTELATDS